MINAASLTFDPERELEELCATVEALEFLCDRLREGDMTYAELALHALRELTNSELLPYLRHQIELVPPMHRAVLEDTARRLERRMR